MKRNTWLFLITGLLILLIAVAIKFQPHIAQLSNDSLIDDSPGAALATDHCRSNNFITSIFNTLSDLVATKIDEAPSDGKQYGRQNKVWTVVQGGGTAGVTSITGSEFILADKATGDVKLSAVGLATDTALAQTNANVGTNATAIATNTADIKKKANIGDSYTKTESDNKYQPKGNYLGPAPKDGVLYGQQNNAWTPIPGGSMNFPIGFSAAFFDSAPDATWLPRTGQQYSAKDYQALYDWSIANNVRCATPDEWPFDKTKWCRWDSSTNMPNWTLGIGAEIDVVDFVSAPSAINLEASSDNTDCTVESSDYIPVTGNEKGAISCPFSVMIKASQAFIDAKTEVNIQVDMYDGSKSHVGQGNAHVTSTTTDWFKYIDTQKIGASIEWMTITITLVGKGLKAGDYVVVDDLVINNGTINLVPNGEFTYTPGDSYFRLPDDSDYIKTLPPESGLFIKAK